MPLCILWRREGNQVMGGFHSGGATIILSYIRGTPSGGLQPIHGGGGGNPPNWATLWGGATPPMGNPVASWLDHKIPEKSQNNKIE